MRRAFAKPILIAAALCLPFLVGTGSCHKNTDPIIFVHGGSGSGAQFESQQMRFTSNGYKQGHIAVVEYDSNLVFPAQIEVVLGAIDARIAELQAATGREQVVLMGHSRGTTVSHAYLAFPDRAAKVSKYVNIDGATAAALPGGVPTLALWAGAARPVQGEIVGATNVTIPNQEHIEVATSEESFIEMYQFIHGHPPFTSEILPEIRPRIAGRATLFPQNFGLDGATLNVWWVNGDTGERIGGQPKATYAIGPDGHWGPFNGWFGLSYEFELSRPDEVTLNYFYEPFLRDDHLVRLNVAEGLAPFIDSSEESTALTVVRFKEFWGDRGAENDVLDVGGTNVITAVNARSGAVGLASSAVFLFDDGSDETSSFAAIPFPFGPLAFLTAADFFIPSQPPGTLSVTTVPRGDADAARTVNVRNLPSTTNRVVIQLNDFEQ
jgi:pimeloyl-ACP methyl ester carboxylesterase